MKRILFLSLLFSSFAHAINLNVRIYSTLNISKVQIVLLSGKYTIFQDTTKITDIYQDMTVELSSTIDNKVKLKKNGEDFGTFSELTFTGQGFLNTLNIMPLTPLNKERVYNDNLKIYSVKGFLEIINNVELEHYVAGVVEAEGNGKYPIEFFKVQSIICRTYSLANIRKHLKESGYNLCDDIHCQAYKGRCKSNPIMMATSQTVTLVIVDQFNKPISAAFHSNCGGQTMNSQDVWSVPTPYLKSKTDTFCLKKPNARWKVKILKKDLLDLIIKKYKFPVNDSLAFLKICNFRQTTRLINLCEKPIIPLKSIRTEFKLKSTFFSLVENGDTLLVTGRGYGHGVGLCQEGAMRMVSLGFSYTSIIQYYYTDVKIIPYEDIRLY